MLNILLTLMIMFLISCGVKHEQAVTTNLEGTNVKSFVQTEDAKLQSAIIADDPDLVEQLLLKGASAKKSVGSKDDTYLHSAIAAGSIEIVELLINHGADPFAKNKDGISAMDLLNEQQSPEMASVLHREPITVETHNKLLVAAVKGNRYARAKYNLEKGANPNAIDERKSSVLMLAVSQKNVQLVTLLVSWPGINLNYKLRKTALGMAVDQLNKDKSTGQNIADISKIVELLKEKGAQ